MECTFDAELKITDLLRRFRGQAAYFDELSGNNGDDLISNGARHAITSAGLNLVASPDRADVLIVTGGAGLSSVWGGAYERIRPYAAEENRRRPLIILPSTISIESFDLPGVLQSRSAPTYVFAREKLTLSRIRDGRWNADTTLAIDDDMAFHLKTSDWLTTVASRARDKHLLIVERRDAEALSGPADRAVPAPAPLKRLVPQGLKRAIKRRTHVRARAGTPFAAWARSAAFERFGLDADTAVMTIDASLKGLLTFDQFVAAIADATAVITTRLHVAILASLLGKRTLVVPGDARYGKIQGIYEYSLRDQPHVTLIDNPFAEADQTPER